MAAKTKKRPKPSAASNGPPSPGATHTFATVMPFDVLTPSQAASYLQVGEDVVTREAEAGRLPGQKLGEQWRFLRVAIVEWLRSGSELAAASKPKSSKERMLALAGMWKDDPTVDAMIEEIYRQRITSSVAGK